MPDGQDTLSAGGAATPGSPGPPGASRPPGAAPAAAGQPPLGRATGISPATQETGQQGLEMQAAVAASFLANQLAQFAGRLGMHSGLGSALHKAAGILAKAVPPGSVPPGAEQALMQKLAMAAHQNQANVAAMRQQPGGANAGGPQAGVQPPPMPRPPQTPEGAGMGQMQMAA